MFVMSGATDPSPRRISFGIVSQTRFVWVYNDLHQIKKKRVDRRDACPPSRPLICNDLHQIKKKREDRRPACQQSKNPARPIYYLFASGLRKMFVMSGRPTYHPDAFLSESFRKPDSFGYISASYLLKSLWKTGCPLPHTPLLDLSAAPMQPIHPSESKSHLGYAYKHGGSFHHILLPNLPKL